METHVCMGTSPSPDLCVWIFGMLRGYVRGKAAQDAAETALMASASSMSICSIRCIDCATVTLCEPAQAVQEQTGHLGDFSDIKLWM